MIVFIKRIILVLLISLLIKTWSFSQTISTPCIVRDSLVLISLPQLKKTNLIFLEHRKFKVQNELLNTQIKHLNNLNYEYERIDSSRKEQLITFSQVVQTQNVKIDALNNALDKQKKRSKVKNYIIGGAIAITIVTVLISALK